jgi:hypothetical protein
MIYTLIFLDLLLKAMKMPVASPVDGPLVGSKVALYVNNLAPTPGTVWGDLTEATFDGYARSSAITYATPFISSTTLVPVMAGDAKTFLCTGQTVTETVYGYAIVSGATPPVVLTVRPLDTPELMTTGGGLIIVPRVGVDPAAMVPPGDVTVT